MSKICTFNVRSAPHLKNICTFSADVSGTFRGHRLVQNLTYVFEWGQLELVLCLSSFDNTCRKWNFMMYKLLGHHFSYHMINSWNSMHMAKREGPPQINRHLSPLFFEMRDSLRVHLISTFTSKERCLSIKNTLFSGITNVETPQKVFKTQKHTFWHFLNASCQAVSLKSDRFFSFFKFFHFFLFFAIKIIVSTV